MSFLQRTARAALWSAAGKWVQALVGFLSLAVIARAVGPEGYGLFAMVMVVLALGEIFVTGALTESLIQHRDPQRGHADAMTWITVAIGLCGWGLVVLAAEPAAALVGDPRAAQYLPAAGAVLVIWAVGATPFSLLLRDLRLAAVTGGETLAALCASGAGIALALSGFGVWSLVVMELVRAVVRTSSWAWSARWRPGFSGRWRHAAELAAFNGLTVVQRGFFFVEKQAPRALAGALLGAEALGFLALAQRLYEQVQAVLVDPLNSLALPAAARVRDDPVQLRALMEGAIRVASTVAYPAFLGLAAVSPVLVPLLFGAAWAPAVLAVQAYLLLGLRAGQISFNGGVLRGLGRPGLHLIVTVWGALLTVVLTPLAAVWGAAAVALALAVRGFLIWPLGAWFVRRLTGYGLKDQARAGLPSAAASVVMAAAVGAFLAVTAGWGEAVRLPAAIALGAAVYPAVLLMLWPAAPREALALLRAVRGGAPEPAATPAR